MKPITEELRELTIMTPVELADRYELLFGHPPRIKNRQWLWKRIAWKLQERRWGGLSGAARARLDALIAELDLPLDERRRTVKGRLWPAVPASAPKPGTVLARTWKGREIRVEVTENGYLYESEVYRSLSAVARAVTGSRWNGRLFFGLTQRGGKSGGNGN